jgi:hypothetical protein
LGQRNAYILCQELGNLLDIYKSKFNLFITTLDKVVLDGKFIGSGRTIFYIPLPRLSYKSSLELLSNQKYGTTLIHKRLTACCCGHPRLLEIVSKVKMDINLSFNDALKVIILDIQRSAKDIISINEISLRLVLIAEPLELFKEIDKDLTVSNYIMKGYFLNSSFEHETNIVPYTSIFALFNYVKSNNSNPLTLAISNLLEIENFFIQTGVGYEKFHAYWEILWSQLKPTKLPKYFKLLDSYSRMDLISTPKQTLNPSKNNFDFYDGFLEANGSIVLPKDYYNYIFSFGPTNPGFDLLIFDKLSDGRNLLITIECKFSNVDAKTILNEEDVIKKLILTEEKIGPYLKGGKESSNLSQLKIEPSNFYKVFILYRKLTVDFYKNLVKKLLNSSGDLDDDTKIKKNLANLKNIIIIDRTDLERLYGPTLSFLEQFLCEEDVIPQSIQTKDQFSPGDGNLNISSPSLFQSFDSEQRIRSSSEFESSLETGNSKKRKGGLLESPFEKKNNKN